MNERNPDEIGALWLKTSKGNESTGKKPTKYLSGMVNGQNIVVFKVPDDITTKPGYKGPNYRILKSNPPGGGSAPAPAQAAPKAAPKAAPRTTPVPAPVDDENPL